MRLGDLQDRRGMRHLQVHSKGSKNRYVPLHLLLPAQLRPTSKRQATATTIPGRRPGR